MSTYNGWSNYATWRINLEMVDGFFGSNMPVEDISDIADYLQEYCISLIEESTPDGLAKDYAFAFLGDVNWYEIAEHIVEDYGGDEEEETNSDEVTA
jgi:dTDP-4-dehydrorhamnose reductase